MQQSKSQEHRPQNPLAIATSQATNKLDKVLSTLFTSTNQILPQINSYSRHSSEIKQILESEADNNYQQAFFKVFEAHLVSATSKASPIFPLLSIPAQNLIRVIESFLYHLFPKNRTEKAPHIIKNIELQLWLRCILQIESYIFINFAKKNVIQTQSARFVRIFKSLYSLKFQNFNQDQRYELFQNIIKSSAGIQDYAKVLILSQYRIEKQQSIIKAKQFYVQVYNQVIFKTDSNRLHCCQLNNYFHYCWQHFQPKQLIESFFTNMKRCFRRNKLLVPLIGSVVQSLNSVEHVAEYIVCQVLGESYLYDQQVLDQVSKALQVLSNSLFKSIRKSQGKAKGDDEESKSQQVTVGKKIGDYMINLINSQKDSQQNKLRIIVNALAFFSSKNLSIEQFNDILNQLFESLFDTLNLLTGEIRKQSVSLIVKFLTPLFNLFENESTQIKTLNNFKIPSNYYKKILKAKIYPTEFYLITQILKSQLSSSFIQELQKQIQSSGLLSTSKVPTGGQNQSQTLLQLYCLTKYSSREKFAQFLKNNPNISSNLIAKQSAFSQTNFLSGSNDNQIEASMYFCILLKFEQINGNNLDQNHKFRVYLNLLTMYLRGKGQLLLRTITPLFFQSVDGKIGQNIVNLMLQVMHSLIYDHGTSTKTNDKILQLLYKIIEQNESKFSTNKHLVFKAIELLHHETINYHNDKFQTFVQKINKMGVKRFAQIQQNPFYKLLKQFLLDAKQDIELSPLTSKYLLIFPRVGYSLQLLGLYDLQLHLTLTQVLRNMGNMFQPLRELRNSFQNELECLSQHEVNYLASVVRDMGQMMNVSMQQVVDVQQVKKEQDKVEQVQQKKKQQELQEMQQSQEVTVSIDDLLKASAGKKKGKKSKGKGATATAGKGKKKPSGKEPAVAATSSVSAAQTENNKNTQVPMTSISKQEKYQINVNQILKFLQLMQNKIQKTSKQLLTTFEFAHKCSSILNRILQNSLEQLVSLLTTEQLQYRCSMFINYIFNVHANSFSPQFNSHLIHILPSFAKNYYNKDEIDDVELIIKQLGHKNRQIKRGLGEYLITIRIAGYVLGSNEAMLGMKIKALNAVDSLLPDITDIINSEKKYQFLEYLSDMTHSMMLSNFNAHSQLQTYLREFILLLSKNYHKLLYNLIVSLFEFDPLCRVTLVKVLSSLPPQNPSHPEPKQIINLKTICNRTLLVRLWLLLFDDNIQMRKNARKIWNSHNFVLINLLINHEKQDQNLLFYLKHSDSMIQDMCSKSIISLVNIFSQELDLIVQALRNFYNQDIELLARVRAQQIAFDTPLHLCNAQQYKLVRDTPISQRKIVTRILSQCIELMSFKTMHSLIDFVIEVGSIDQDEEIRQRFVDIGVKIIDMRGNQFSQDLLKQLNSKIQSDNQKMSNMRKESQNTAVILCANLAGFVSSQTKGLKQLFMRVLELSKSSTLQQLRAIAKALPHLALHFPKLATTTIDKLLVELFQDNQKYAIVQSSSYAIAGLMKGLGSIRMIEERKLIEQCRSYFTKQKQKENGYQRLATFVLYRAFADVLGKTFEIFLKEVMPDILASYSDSKDFVKNQVAKLMKSLVMTLSGFAVKVLIPQFLEGIKQDSWRTKLASAQALGSMAFCAPKQLSMYLPKIVNQLKDILTDAQPKVAESGIKALGSIGSVAQNPEVAQISNSLINALKDPQHGLKISLDVLLKTNFSHLIDAPSLSLLIPVLYNGLFSHLPQNNINAAIVVGHICQLIQVPQDLIPYLDIIMPALRATLFSADPAVRSTAASAVGSLSKGLGLKNSNDLLIWLKSILKSTTGSSTQKSGAAHGLSQVITAHGQSLFEQLLPELLEQSRDANGGVRQAFRGIFAFLPKSYGQEFQKYFGYLLPLVMQGLSDTYQGVRSISTRTMRVLVEQYGSNHSQTFLSLLRQKALAPDWRMRENALVLLTQFIDSIKQDMHRQNPVNITVKERNDILALLFMMKFDPNQKVNAICSFEWKHLVHNQPLVIKSVFSNLMQLCCQRITDPKSSQLQAVASYCFSGIVGKFRDRFIRDTLDYFKKNLLFMNDEEKDRVDARQFVVVPEGYKNYDNVVIICQALKNMFSEADVGLLTPYRHEIVNLIFPLFFSDVKHLRVDAADVLAILLLKIQEQQEEYLTFVFRLIIEQMQLQSPSISSKVQQRGTIEQSKQQTKENDKKQAYLNQTQQHLSPGYKLLDCLQHLSTYYQKIQYRKMVLPIIYDTFQRYDVHSNTIGIFKDNLQPWHLRALSTLANHIGSQTFKRKRHTLVIRFLLTTLEDRNLPLDLCDGCVYSLKKLIVQVPTEDLSILWGLLDDFIKAHDLNQQNKQHRDRYNFYFCTVMNYYFQNHTESYSSISQNAFLRLISLVNNNDSSDVVVNAVTESIFSLLAGLSQEVHQIFIPILADQLRGHPKSTSKLFATNQGLDTFITLTLNSVSRGTTDLRREAALAMRYILITSHNKLSRTLIMKISGQLIRVVMDRFGDQLKRQIYIAFDIIISNLNVAILAPQLQSTFTRAITQYSSSDLSIYVGEILIKILKQKMRVDQILRDFETTAKKIESALSLGDQSDEQVIRNNAQILYSITHCETLILRYFSGKEISTDSRKNLLESFQKRITLSIERGKNSDEIKKIGEISALALGYLQPHLIEGDVSSVWSSVFTSSVPFNLKIIGLISFITSGVQNAAELFEQQLVQIIKKSDVDLSAVRKGLLINLSLLKKCIGRERLILKGAQIFCADQIEKGLLCVLKHYIQRVRDFKSVTEDIISQVLNGDKELFKLLPIPKNKDGSKYLNVAKETLENIINKAKLEEGDDEDELQFAKCLALKVGSINKLQYESIYSLRDLAEVKNA